MVWPGDRVGSGHPGVRRANFFRWRQGCQRQPPSKIAACPDSSTDSYRGSFELRSFSFQSIDMPCQLGPTLSFIKPIDFLSAFGIGGYDPTTSLPVEICWKKGNGTGVWGESSHYPLLPQRITCVQWGICGLYRLIFKKLERDQICPPEGNG